MTKFRRNEIPKQLRPYNPYFLEEETATRVVLRKNGSAMVAISLLLTLLHAILSIVFSDMIYLILAVAFVIQVVAFAIEDGYARIMVDASGITLVRKFLFFSSTTFIDRKDVRNLVCQQAKLNDQSSRGRILVLLIDGKKRILQMYRPNLDDVSNDLRTIAANMERILEMPMVTA